MTQLERYLDLKWHYAWMRMLIVGVLGGVAVLVWWAWYAGMARVEFSVIASMVCVVGATGFVLIARSNYENLVGDLRRDGFVPPDDERG